MKTRFENLAELRTTLLGYHDAAFISAETGIAPARLARIESGTEPLTIQEARRLSAIYGIEPRRLSESPITLQYGDGITTLALSSEFQRVPPATRARIAATANAARDLVDLEEMAGESNRWVQFSSEIGRLRPPRIKQSTTTPHHPYHEGRHYAAELRRHLSINGPIGSMRDLLSQRLPAIAVLHAHLGRDCDLAAVSFADMRRGPTIVVNLDGRNENPLVRRFSLAHELCHLAVDWNRMEPLAMISEHRDDAQLAIEQRANGFAIRFLCPRQAIPKPGVRAANEALEHLIAQWGLHYQAAILDLKKSGYAENDIKKATVKLHHERWVEAERIQGVFDFPVESVPTERRTRIAWLAARLYLDKRLSAEEFSYRLALPGLDYASLASVLRYLGHEEEAITARENEEREQFPLRGLPYFMSDDFNDPLDWGDPSSW